MIDEILNFACRLKHPGFKEEKEYRFVFKGDLSDVMVREKGDILTTYVEAFQFEGQVPIEKIIVGPGRNQQRICDNIHMHEKNSDIPIVLSSIPFIWS